MAHRSVFWAALEIRWHFVRTQSQPKAWMAPCVVFRVVGDSWSSRHAIASMAERRTTPLPPRPSSSFAPFHPEKPRKGKPGKEEAAEGEQQFPPFCPTPPSPCPETTKHPIAAWRLHWNESRGRCIVSFQASWSEEPRGARRSLRSPGLPGPVLQCLLIGI